MILAACESSGVGRVLENMSIGGGIAVAVVAVAVACIAVAFFKYA